MPRPKRIRVLLLTRNLPPLVGGMERLNWHMADELSRRVQVRVVGPSGAASVAPSMVNVREVPLRPLWKFLLSIQFAGLREAWRWKPDVVLAGSGLTALSAWFAARCVRAACVTYVHGLDVTVAHPIYRRVWLAALRRMDSVFTNSHASAALVRKVGVMPERIRVVHPGVDIPAHFASAPRLSDFRRKYELDDRPLLLSVGRLSARKGLREFVVQAMPEIVSACPDVLLAVIGDVPKDALQAETQTPPSILAAAESVGVEGNVRFLGPLTDEDLALAYQTAAVHVFSVREIVGDPEGFGMVAVESAAHGLPTVAFACGGVVDAVRQDVSGCLVNPGDYHAFAAAVADVLHSKRQMRASSIDFARRFAWPVFGTALLQGLEQSMKSPKRGAGEWDGA